MLLGNSVAGSGNDSGNGSDDTGVEGLRSHNGGFSSSNVNNFSFSSGSFGFRFSNNYSISNALEGFSVRVLRTSSNTAGLFVVVDIVNLESETEGLASSEVVHRERALNYPTVVILNSNVLGSINALFPSYSAVTVTAEEEVAVSSSVDLALQIFIEEPHFSSVVVPALVNRGARG